MDTLSVIENPANKLRMINHWDNLDGSVERGYAGESIFFRDQAVIEGLSRIRDYAGCWPLAAQCHSDQQRQCP